MLGTTDFSAVNILLHIKQNYNKLWNYFVWVAWAFLICNKMLLSSSRFLLALMCVPNWKKLITIFSYISMYKYKYTYPSLQEFQCTLVLGYLQQFHGSLFKWSMAHNFSYNISDEFVVLSVFLEKKKYYSVIFC